MNPLPLTPLPATRLDQDSASWQMEREGFVDEAVVARLLAAPRGPRLQATQDDLALAADDLDFAGWQMAAPAMAPLSSPSYDPEAMPSMREITGRRATPPAIAEAGIHHPHRGKHRWWLAGLAGALSTLIFSLLLFAFSQRMSADPKAPITSTNPVAPAIAKKAKKGDPPAPLASSSRNSLR